MRIPFLRYLIFLSFSVLGAACGKGQSEIKPPEIYYGETECLECRMIISDRRFAAGYTYAVSEGRYESVPFDDIGDMLNYVNKHPEHQIVEFWVHDFTTEEWIRAQDAFYIISQHLETPMAFGMAASDTREKAQGLAAEYHGELLDWNGLLARHHAGELVALVAETAVVNSQEMMSGLSKDETRVMLGKADVAGYDLTLLAYGPLHAGYNHLMLHLTNLGGETVTHAYVSFAPLVHRPEMILSAPVEQPDTHVHPDGYFGGAVGFPPPTVSDLGDWELVVTFSDPANGAKGEASIPVEVAPSELVGTFVATDDESKLFLMAVSPQEAGIGLQPIEILAVEQQNALEWIPVDDLTLEIAPEMPTMGHGSPNNENPTFIGNGHYQGKVNFTMIGPWKVKVRASRGGSEMGELVFEYDVK